MDREHTNWSKAEEASQKPSVFGVSVAAEFPVCELPFDCSRVWEMPVPDWKMRIYELMFRF